MYPTFDSVFWSAFWPGLLSTLVGVVLGVPVGLFLTALARRTQKRAELGVERERLTAALHTIRHALDANEWQLARLGELPTGQVITAPVLNTVAWDAVKLDVVSYLRDPGLQAELAELFVEIEDVRRLNDRYLELMMGVGSALASAATNREVLRSHVTARAQKLTKTIDVLKPRLDGAIAAR